MSAKKAVYFPEGHYAAVAELATKRGMTTTAMFSLIVWEYLQPAAKPGATPTKEVPAADWRASRELRLAIGALKLTLPGTILREEDFPKIIADHGDEYLRLAAAEGRPEWTLETLPDAVKWLDTHPRTAKEEKEWKPIDRAAKARAKQTTDQFIADSQQAIRHQVDEETKQARITQGRRTAADWEE